MYCRNCGNPLPDMSRFCDRCGARVETAQPVRPAPAAQQGFVQNSNVQSSVKKPVKAKKKSPVLKIAALIFCALFFVSVYSELSLPEMIEAVKLGEPLTHRAMYKLEDTLNEKKTSITIYKREWDTSICPWEQAEDYLMEYIHGNPELFYVDIKNTEFFFVEGEESPYYKIKFAYFDKLTGEKAQKKLETVADKLINSVPEGASDWETALHLHDALVRRVTYTEGKTDQTAYAALVEGKAVCMGYAMAYEYLLNRAGVECDTIVGYADEFSAAMDGTVLQDDQHAWSIVTFREDGVERSYFVDTTWDDLGLTDSYGNEYISHRWFCVTADDMEKEGRVVVDEIYDMSKWNLNDDKFNYYAYTGTLINSYDFDEVAGLLRKQLLEGKNNLSIRVADLDTYYDLKFDMEDNGGLQALFDVLGVDSFNYNYSYDYKSTGLICFDIYLDFPDS